MRISNGLFAVVILFLAASGSAQDVLTIGSGSASSGGAAALPVSIADKNGTSLGSDAGTGNRIQGFAFKVLYSTDLVDSVSFARAGVTASLTPLYETTLQGDGFIAYVVSFSELSNAIPFTPNAGAPGDTIGTLTVTLKASAPAGSSATLTLDPPSAIFSNQSASVLETVSNGSLSLVNGSVSVILAAPSGVVASAVSPSQVNVTWNAVTNADHYEVWRSVDGAAYALAGSPSAPALSDTTVTGGKTYLYRVLAIDGAGVMSAFSSVDPATTIFFDDDPLVAQSTIIEAAHFNDVRTAVNAFRASASLDALPADATVAAGAPVLGQHIIDLRTGLDAARSIAGVIAISYADTTLTPGVTLIKASHLQELRNGVK